MQAVKQAYTGQTNITLDTSANTEIVVQNTEGGKVVYIFTPIYFEGTCTIRDLTFKYKAKLSPRVAKESLDKFPKCLTESLMETYSDYIQTMSRSFDNATIEIQARNGLPLCDPKPMCAQDNHSDIICTIDSYEQI